MKKTNSRPKFSGIMTSLTTDKVYTFMYLPVKLKTGGFKFVLFSFACFLIIIS